MKKESLYLDTSVPSAYYDERVKWRLEYTRQWWGDELHKYDVFISEVVIAEISGTENIRRRNELLELVKKFSELKLSPEIEEIAKGYVNQKVIPQSHFPDALHIAIASFHKIDFLITWNCEHLAEAHRRKRVRLFNTSAGLFVPEIVTPMELVEEGEEDV
ncbi:type II toxin-antitoxin system VapC family toxin [bacterium]|nr:type II toxin-antitoxin system VapC family toxin [bacterium]MBU1599954.1 type II toxin-antitoxin system VapC family toxin [bacterium]